MIVLIDNYDSFTFNLRRYFVRLGQEVEVLRNDVAQLHEAIEARARAIVISPGPRAPTDAGQCLDVVRRWSGHLPILGVCLGHQVIVQAFGGRVGHAVRPVHGRSLPVQLASSRLFQQLSPVEHFARYHSLVGLRELLPDCLRITATSSDDEIMAVEHRSHATYGVQFHPESVLSAGGYRVLANFLQIAGLDNQPELPQNDFASLDEASEMPLSATWEHAVPLPGKRGLQPDEVHP